MKSFSVIYFHIVWTTKNREPLIFLEHEHEVYREMYRKFEECHCKVIALNGTNDHVHAFVRFDYRQSIAQTISQVKGASSRYINDNGFSPVKFSWQRGFSIFSVSRWDVEKIKRYVQNQKAHHGLMK